jgi:hypothetical protein
MTFAATVLAFGWAPEIRGITVVLIAVVALMGSTYLVLGTNLGARLGFLVAVAALFGWISCMGAIWATYGIGLKGRDPTWVAKEIVNDGDLSNAASAIIRNSPNLTDATTTERADGWILLETDNPKRGQAVASAEDILVNKAQVLPAGSFEATRVFDKGGARYPLYFEFGPHGKWHFDWLSFWHKPHFALVEVHPLVPQNTEPGKAPPPPVIDETQPPRYVLMERDLGTRRQPAFFICIGSSIIFGVLCFMLHRRDAFVEENRRAAALPARATAGAEA